MRGIGHEAADSLRADYVPTRDSLDLAGGKITQQKNLGIPSVLNIALKHPLILEGHTGKGKALFHLLPRPKHLNDDSIGRKGAGKGKGSSSSMSFDEMMKGSKGSKGKGKGFGRFGKGKY